MKILITILLTLFISSQAIAQDYTKKDMCLWAGLNLEGTFSKYKHNFNKMMSAIENDEGRDSKIFYNRGEVQKKEFIQFSYKNLDCADIAPLK